MWYVDIIIIFFYLFQLIGDSDYSILADFVAINMETDKLLLQQVLAEPDVRVLSKIFFHSFYIHLHLITMLVHIYMMLRCSI